ncbi:4-hydroxy-tetrahydrodipicolinate reductase [Gillisia limnaea]|uniref:4-hydroxy-tetrahydrodipicolinate reductase n=1 Tax=Gillisia limnaea (strain DSM 15749 / LMG 21470 / R-8282) TaxID=865937 RepID=H2BR72_GILLR|nr:4-hydroxy-tetrahydrodipicolinate reductase [Gillisia limnaea]EHQ04391.1 dihydrodipicolinate reductase [Gillisia limnaea DSM 15749]
MKIALSGYGKMGKTIEKIALGRGHEIVLKISENIEEYNLSEAEIVIDFSIPTVALKNITTCFQNKLPVVSGTTGWLKDYEKAVQVCNEENSGFIYASNFSIGVNLFFELNEKLAKMMDGFKDYSVEIEEIHHTQKLDAPSGTAISLAQQIINNSSKDGWELDKAKENEIPIYAKRIENVPGTHRVSYNSEVDSIEIKHTAHSREGFALGAVIAAEWLFNKKGVYTMKDVLSGLS